MPSVRPWIGIALLAVSWLLGLDYYETASPRAQAVVLIVGAWLLAAGATRKAYPKGTVPFSSNENRDSPPAPRGKPILN